MIKPPNLQTLLLGARLQSLADALRPALQELATTAHRRLKSIFGTDTSTLPNLSTLEWLEVIQAAKPGQIVRVPSNKLKLILSSISNSTQTRRHPSMAVTKEIAQEQMLNKPHVTDRPEQVSIAPSFSFERNFSILRFNGGGHLLQQEGGSWARAFSDTEQMIQFLIEQKANLYEGKPQIHTDGAEFGAGCSDKTVNEEPSPHDYQEPIIRRGPRGGARDAG